MKTMSPKEAIKALGYKTQKEAAYAAGVHQVPFNMYLNKKRFPDIANYKKIVAFFGALVDPAEFER